MSRSSDIVAISEYIKDILYFGVVKQGKVLYDTDETHYFCIDYDLVYEQYYSDFGPLNLGCVYKYCKLLNAKIKQYLNKQIVVHYTSLDSKKKANAAFLLGCYGVLCLSLPPEEALRPLTSHGQTYRPFQDAVQGDSMYTISLIDCLLAIKKAQDLGFFNFQDFNCDAYDKLDKIRGGDLNWIVPGKFLAFMGPIAIDYKTHSFYHPPETYIDYFLENNVRMVIRLNKRLYDETKFTNYGILHHDLIFPDGSCPPKNILFKFLQLSEEFDGAIGVHCKAGLGRTGSLIGCYLIKHYRMTSHEAIAWMRICRPGSVIGHQQHWLEQLEPWLIKQGILYRKRNYKDTDRLPVHEFGIYSSSKRSMQTSVVSSSSRSPPPQRIIIPNFSLSPRPRNSRVREVPGKMLEKEQCEWRVTDNNFNINCGQRNNRETNTTQILARTSNASGEPRVTRPKSRVGSAQVKVKTTESNFIHATHQSPTRRSVAYSSTASPLFSHYQNSNSTVKTVTEAKTLLSSSSFNRQNRTSELSSVIKVTRHNPTPATTLLNFPLRTDGPGKIPSVPASTYSSASRGPSQPQNRRRGRLGRSPSPPQSRPSEQTRATNTIPTTERVLSRELSKINIKEALSKLKVVVPRERSLGAASMGARQQKQTQLPTPSVRSDERHLATQGDLLNCIKFQRRLRESQNTDHKPCVNKAEIENNSRQSRESNAFSPYIMSSLVGNKATRTECALHGAGGTVGNIRPSYSRLPAKNMPPKQQTSKLIQSMNTQIEHHNCQRNINPVISGITGTDPKYNCRVYQMERLTVTRPKSPSPNRLTSPKGRTRPNQDLLKKFY